MNLTFDMLINSKDKTLTMQLYKESTNVFPYYIGLSILMIDPIGFVNWCGEKNINIFRFQKTDETIIDFGHYIVDESNKQVTRKTFNKMFKLVSKLPDNMKNTTKMTMCETK